MDEKKKTKLNIFEKLKNIKHIEIIVIAIFCAILLLIYSTSFSTKKTENVTTTTLTTEEYATYLENKLTSVLGHIQGAGKVNVMITLSCGIEYVYTKNTEEVTTNSQSSGTSKTTKTEDLVFVSVSGKSTPVILKQNLPKVSGVIIVASGAKNINVRLELQKAVEALLDVQVENIEILVGE